MKTPNEIRKNWNSIIENFKSRVNEEDFEDMEDSEGGKLSPELAAKINAELKGQTIKNPETDNDIQVTSALGYDKGSAVYKDAKKVFDKALEKVTGKQKSGAPDSEPAEEEPGKLAGDDFKSAAEKDKEPTKPSKGSVNPSDYDMDDPEQVKAYEKAAYAPLKKIAPHLFDPETGEINKNHPQLQDPEYDMTDPYANTDDPEYDMTDPYANTDDPEIDSDDGSNIDSDDDWWNQDPSKYDTRPIDSDEDGNIDSEYDTRPIDSDEDGNIDSDDDDDWWNQDPSKYEGIVNKFNRDLIQLINEINNSIK